AEGTFAPVDVGFHVSETGSYLPPVSVTPLAVVPPHTIISDPVQTAVCPERPAGTPVTDVGCQVSLTGSYRPPAPKFWSLPHTSTWDPVHTAVAPYRGAGELNMAVGVHVSVAGLYRNPVRRRVLVQVSVSPPHTIISLPVHTNAGALRAVQSPPE